MIYFHRPREESMSLGPGVFQTLMRCTLWRQPPRIKRFCIRFSLTLYLSGKIAFSPQQRLIYFQYPLHRFYDQSHASVSPLSSGDGADVWIGRPEIPHFHSSASSKSRYTTSFCYISGWPGLRHISPHTA